MQMLLPQTNGECLVNTETRLVTYMYMHTVLLYIFWIVLQQAEERLCDTDVTDNTQKTEKSLQSLYPHVKKSLLQGVSVECKPYKSVWGFVELKLHDLKGIWGTKIRVENTLIHLRIECKYLYCSIWSVNCMSVFLIVFLSVWVCVCPADPPLVHIPRALRQSATPPGAVEGVWLCLRPDHWQSQRLWRLCCKCGLRSHSDPAFA